MTSTANLKISRDSLKARISKIKTYVLETHQETDPIENVIVRAELLEEQWKQYDAVQTQLERKENLERETEGETVEDMYLTARAKILQFQNQHAKKIEAEKPVKTSSTNETMHQVTTTSIAGKVKLPKLNIPIFDGKYEQWRSFYDIFMSVIDKNETISSIEKLFYLRSSLKGEALKIIESIQASEENYEVALQLLVDRYDNTNYIINAHIRALFEMPSVSKDSLSGTRTILSETKQHLRSLKALKLETEYWDPLIMYIMLQKLDIGTRRAWELQKQDNVLPKLDTFYKFLEHRCVSLESVSQHDNTVKFKPSIKPRQTSSYVSTPNNNANKNNYLICNLCKGSHYLVQCKSYLKLNHDERVNIIKVNRLCFNCLKQNHSARECRGRKCEKCNKTHHVTIHRDEAEAAVSQKEHSQDQQDKPEMPETKTSYFNASEMKQILLATVELKVRDHKGNWQRARALLDSGSQCNFVTAEFVKKLNLKSEPVEINLSGINKQNSQIKRSTKVTISSRISNYQSSLDFLIMKEITCMLPNYYIKYDTWKIPKNIELADPKFNVPNNVDLLIGAEIYFEILKKEQVSIANNLPVLQNTEFGWILSGQIRKGRLQHNLQHTSLFTSIKPDLNSELENFWNLEEIRNTTVMTKEEQECEAEFKETTQRDKDGRYIVKLPLKMNPCKLGNSYELAKQRVLSLKRRLDANDELNQGYRNFMNEYHNLDHMEMVKENELSNYPCYYIPHHAIMKTSSSTTKLRVVYDASMKTTSNISLNDILKVGPTVHQDILSIVMRFRLYKFVFTADLQKMYRQIKINETQCDLQRILWLNDENELRIYRLKTVTYGTASAPYLATRTLQQLALDEGNEFPLAKPVLQNDFYVDDVLTGNNQLDEILQVQNELIKLLNRGGFELHKWCSNEETILNKIPLEKREQKQAIFFSKEAVKTLGLIWLPAEDKLKFLINVNEKEVNRLTKRNILSEIARIYDPLGLLGPVIVKAKLFMQRLWKNKTEWDEEVDEEMKRDWMQFREEFKELRDFEINRRITNLDASDMSYEIHGFCDASMQAYGACIYLKCLNGENTSVTLICAKSRIAPIKPITLPRLELCGALILSRLLQKVVESLQLKKVRGIYLWTDSTIVLHWIGAQATRWKMFVGNRVTEIQDLTNNCIWNHVKGGENPADIISRGLNAKELRSSELWWQGPRWIHESNESWPIETNLKIDEVDLEERTIITSNVVVELKVFNKYSSLIKLKRIFAYVLRFINNIKLKSKNKEMSGHLTANELQNSMKNLIKLAQRQEFATEIELLKRFESIKDGNLLKLTPFLDSDGILRIGGRLEKLEIPYNKKHPIILPPNHNLTHLILRHEHLKLFHAGGQAVLASIRENYWPLRARNMIRKIIHDCVICYRMKAEQSKQLMGNIPSYRGSTIKAFNDTGVDYGGPFIIKVSSRRNSPTTKAYIALFVCLSTRAIHLEIVSDLSTQAFLAALKRFLARRGKVQTIYSDNATNFKGAQNQLNELYQLFKNENSRNEIINSAANQEITWRFIPPNAPHFGGIWEAGIKTVKHHLKRVIGQTRYTFEEFYTLISQIESCVNSRPLCPISDDPSDYSYLTPAHFLTGASQVVVPEPKLNEIPENRLSMYQLVQRQVQSFWKQWSREYLHTLQQRLKWQHVHPNVQIGTVVLVKEDNIPPANWIMGRVIEVHPGEDNLVRVVTIKTSASVFKRPVSKLCVLPIADNVRVLKGDLSRGPKC